MELSRLHRTVKRGRSDGFTLIEGLIALFVFTVALLGIAALLARSVSVSHGAYLRSVASMQALDIAERIRANVLLTPSEMAYGGFTSCKAGSLPTVDTSVREQCVANACDKNTLRAWDQTLWCVETAERFGALFRQASITEDSGSYVVSIEWDERVIEDDNQQSIDSRSFTWRVSQ
ncbi:type IV pilus modification protein PilV [Marinobacterium marinum]|uniref:Type IV pilus modification protein PilV n=1 Tax=Marinobacterium marinum TaxID=2756129 RepID=A0A7W1WW43_9GAMM|nr:type IV pilus modification protein PilV [Marinobacterium marinum]MBA4501303.1 type IV pilus modification protein PilV [Marinobacterium marinum]